MDLELALSRPSSIAPKRKNRILHLECFSGAAGNMLLGALFDLGVDSKVVREAVQGLGVPGIRMQVERVKRGSLAANYVSFSGPARDATERRYATIKNLLKHADLSEPVRERAQIIFRKLAEAEARVHGTELDRVHFHEVGAIDALGDIVGVSAALEALEVGRITASAVAVGSGHVETSHGRLPLPAPAAMELLNGIPTYPVEVYWETITPTGAAVLASVVDEFGPLPAMVPSAQGFGAGDDRQGPMPNVLRAVVGETMKAFERDRVIVLETNLDDMNPEHLPYLLEKLMDDGALDVSLSPLAMKKGRPGQLLRVIATPDRADVLTERILLESTTLGVRYQEMERRKLQREESQVETEFGMIRVKRILTPDGRALVTPEYESCAHAAKKHDAPLQQVYRAAERAAELV